MSTAMMWKEWKKYGESENGKSYELMVDSDVQVLLVARLYKLETSSLIWMADISTFNPGAGEYVIYEDVFSSLEKAEEKAWEKAQEVVKNRNESIDLKQNSVTTIHDKVLKQKANSTHEKTRWNGWHKNSDTPHIKQYGLQVKAEDGLFSVSVGMYSPEAETNSSPWSVLITTYYPPPLTKKNIMYEGLFSSFEEAEKQAWKAVQQFKPC